MNSRWRDAGRNSGLLARLVGVEVDRAAGHHGGNGVFVDHQCDGVAQQHYILVKLLDVALELDAIDQIKGHRHVLFAQQVQKRVLQELAFVAHDMFRVG